MNRRDRLQAERNRLAADRTGGLPIRVTVYVYGVIILDTEADEKKARELWRLYRDGDNWIEITVDGRRLRWIEADRMFGAYRYGDFYY